MSTTGKHTMTDGTELFTRAWPHPDPVATVLLVHGVSEHTGRWDHVAEFLVAEGFEVFGFDQRAHGRSGDGILDIEDFTLFVDDVADMISAVRTEGRPLILYGHSMGGLVSVLHAQSAHPKPDVMVLSAPALVADVPGPLRLAARVLGRFAPKLAMASAVEKAHLSRDPDVGEDYVNDPLVYLKGTTRFGRLLFAAMDRAREGIARIATPTLVIHGSDDELVPPRASATLAGIGSVERRVFPGLRHEMHNEPESAEVLGFISRWLHDHLKR